MSDNTLSPQDFLQYLNSQVTRFGTQAAMADFLGVSQNYLSQILRGVRPIPPFVALAFGYEPTTTTYYTKKEN